MVRLQFDDHVQPCVGNRVKIFDEEVVSTSVMKRLIKAVAVVAAFVIAPSSSNAGQRYATPPPVTLSPDLTSPWTLQLKPMKRRASATERRQAKRPAGLKVFQNRSYQPVRPTKRRATERSGVITASTGSQGKQLRATINPGFEPDLLPTVVDYNGEAAPGTLIVNTPERRLYLVMQGGKARRYAVGVGKPGFEWAGTHRVSRKAEWPDWRPPAEMIERERKKGRDLPEFMAGGVKNPLGARALYLGSSIYRIHGTNQPWTIGGNVSSGCIRMRNEDVTDLYSRVKVGTKVIVR